MTESFTEFPFSTYSISFLTDDIIRLRYVCIEGQLRKILVVIKMRGGKHSNDIREYEITSDGLVISGGRLTDYQGLITGIPKHLDRPGQKEKAARKPKPKSKG
jgi:circadian clock protein KaiC